MQTAIDAEKRLSPQEAATYLGVELSTLAVWRSTKRYKIPYLKIGGLVRYRKSDLDAFIESCIVR